MTVQFGGRSRNGSDGSLAPTIADSRNGLGISGFSPSVQRARNGSDGSLAPTIADSLASRDARDGRDGRDGLGISGSGFSSSVRSLSRRWSEGSLLSQSQAQTLGVPEVLRPGFYSPANFQVEGFRPSRNVSFKNPLS